MSRICTRDEDFISHCKEEMSHFIRRVYPKGILDKAYTRCLKERGETLVTKKKQEKNENKDHIFSPIILFTKYRPSCDLVQDTVLENWPITQKSKSTRPLFDVKVKNVTRRAKSIKDYLVWSKLDFHPEGGIKNNKKQYPKTAKQLCKSKSCRVCTTEQVGQNKTEIQCGSI